MVLDNDYMMSSVLQMSGMSRSCIIWYQMWFKPFIAMTYGLAAFSRKQTVEGIREELNPTEAHTL